MTLDNRIDPVSPRLTFDSYVIPETVRKKSPQNPVYDREARTTGPMIAVGVIAVLTFALGVLTTLKFAQPAPDVAEAPVALVEEAPVALALASEAQIAPSATAPEAPEKTTVAATLEEVVSASLGQVVTRQESADLIAPTRTVSRAGGNELRLSEILRGLTPTPTQVNLSTPDAASDTSQEFLSRNKLRMLKEGVLAGTYTVKVVERHGQDRLCLRMPNANVSQDEAAELLRQAAERGEIELPDSLRTAEGHFDADTLIFNLVQTSLSNDGTPEGAEAAREMSRRAFAASNAKTTKVKGERVYIVQPGDSLAYLSLQFYGKPKDYMRIYRANRKILRSPDRIQIGQRLIIPG